MTTDFQTIAIDDINLPAKLRGGVVAIGNFDGFHRGHRAVIDEALTIADKNNCPAILLTFNPHPRTWFSPDKPVYLLTPPQLKAALAEKFGFSAMAIHSFDKNFSSLSADEFIHNILLEKLGATHIVTGHDFHFGAKRQGTPQYLVEAGKEQGFSVTLVKACRDEANEIISSSRIRSHLAAGELTSANALLGYAYSINGTVVSGSKMGRKLGFPTANISLPPNVELKQGIYAVRAIRANGEVHDGVASYGRRPTFDNGETLFETHLFDFDGDLYGEELTVILYSWLREEIKFDGAEELVDQMKLDAQEARQFLTTLPPGHLRWPVGTGISEVGN
ncbi:MAG: bifunctional riboflavin kinase/FAD synthetase [Rhizobiaceae bacterium]|nr:bifunctional riboflavin kinase/FAD synthetase [Rhizobiaceae bacterium]